MAATKLQIYNDVLVLLGEPRLATITDDTQGRYELDNLYDRAVLYVTRQAAWKHAIKIVSPSAGASVYQGFAYSYAKPGDWLRTHAIYTLSGQRESPVDAREIGTNWAVNLNTGVYFRYIASGIAEANWSESFDAALAAYMAFVIAERISGKGEKSETMFQLWQARLAEGAALDAMPESEWLSAQLDGSFQHAAEFILNQGYWRFAEKVVTIGSTSSTLPGFAYKHAKPADWIKTHSIYAIANYHEVPIDVRENAGYWHSHQNSVYVRYISTDGLSAALWPESFTKAVRAFLRFEKNNPDKISAETWAQSMGIASAVDSQPESEWLAAQLDGSFQNAAEFVLNQGYWLFAQKIRTIASTTATLTGFSYSHIKPADWLKTHTIAVLVGGVEQPIDVRDNEGSWHSNSSTGIYVKYISRDNLVLPTTWPESFTKAVKAFVRFERARPDDKGAAETWAQSMQIALEADAQPENEWLSAQLNGSFQRAAEFVLGQGYWRFAQKILAIVGDPLGTFSGYSYRHAKPDDWLRTHSIYSLIDSREQPIDVRESEGYWHSHIEAIYIRYISRDSLLSPATWPENFTKAIRAFIHFEQSTPRDGPHDGPPDKSAVEPWMQAMQSALDKDGQAPSQWLEFQLDGTMLKAARAIAEDGLWNFAEKRVVPDALASTLSGYAYRYLKPDDWIRTIDFYEPNGSVDRFDIPWIDDSGYLHSNSATGVLRYVSSLNIDDPTKWPEQFTAAVLALCELWRASSNPKTSGAALEARQAAYDRALREGKAKDSARSRTRINNSGVVVASRFGRFNGEQGRRY